MICTDLKYGTYLLKEKVFVNMCMFRIAPTVHDRNRIRSAVDLSSSPQGIYEGSVCRLNFTTVVLYANVVFAGMAYEDGPMPVGV